MLEEKGELLKETKIVKNNNNRKVTVEVNGIIYKMGLRKQNLVMSRSTLKRDKDNNGKSVISLKSYYSYKSDIKITLIIQKNMKIPK
jgi:hypothetical protein